MRKLFRLIFFASSWCQCWCCDELFLESSPWGPLLFRPLKRETVIEAGLSARAAYQSVEDDDDDDDDDDDKYGTGGFRKRGNLYLYHCISGGDGRNEGRGRWVINDVLGDRFTAMAYRDTWAVVPHLADDLADNSPMLHGWKTHDGSRFTYNSDIKITCNASRDDTIYFDVSGDAWWLAGFFVKIGVFNDLPLYSKIGAEGEQQVFLYSTDTSWIIGHSIGSNSGVAHTPSKARSATELNNAEWFFVENDNPVWQSFKPSILYGKDGHSVYAVLKQKRFKPKNDFAVYNDLILRNGAPIPNVGLGTGGISHENMAGILKEAFRQGYRLIDTAREYNNEGIIGDSLALPFNNTITRRRENVFLISKVWPTFLGYIPTSLEISKSLELLKTPYLDMYLLHWPSCIESWSWMHCETTVDLAGNWRESWNALERAYAEGRSSSIGVSNFDKPLLQEFATFGTLRPHLVQNFGDLGNLDLEVRNWCTDNGAVYMPYAHQRNLHLLSHSLRKQLESLAELYDVSPHVIVSSFFLQTGAAIIPRTTSAIHLAENLKNTTFIKLKEEDMALLGWPFDNAAKTEL